MYLENLLYKNEVKESLLKNKIYWMKMSQLVIVALKKLMMNLEKVREGTRKRNGNNTVRYLCKFWMLLNQLKFRLKNNKNNKVFKNKKEKLILMRKLRKMKGIFKILVYSK